MSSSDYKLANLYLFGSRLYGCAKPNSDYDFYGIVTGDYFYASKLIDTGPIQLNLFHVDYFKDLLVDNTINSVMLMFVPPEYVWKKEIALEVNLKIPSIQRALRMDSSHNFAKAKRLWKDGTRFRPPFLFQPNTWLYFQEIFTSLRKTLCTAYATYFMDSN